MIATNAFKQAVVGTYTTADTVIQLNSISNTVGNADYLPNGGFNLILYDGLFGNPADANNAGDYEILQCTGVNYATNEITVVRAQENTTAVTIDASSWQVVYGATVAFFDQFEGADLTILKEADIVNDLTTGGANVPGSAENDKTLQDTKAPVQDTDTWVLTTSFTGTTNPITTNLARFTHTDYIGTGMTQASGVFTFPRTGIWRVEFQVYGSTSSASELNFGAGITVITDASGTPVKNIRTDAFNGVKTGIDGFVKPVLNGLEVTATADVKVEFGFTGASVSCIGSTTNFRTGMIFTRIGDL